MDKQSQHTSPGDFFIGLKQHFMEKVVEKAAKSVIKVAGSARSNQYLSPSNFYNHGTRTFLKNKRKGF